MESSCLRSMSVAVPATMCPAMLRRTWALSAAEFRRQFRDEIARNGGKSISVVKTEWSQPVTFQADFKRLGQGEFLGLILLPKSFGRQMSVGSGFVEGVLLFAKAAIDFSDNFPVEWGEPGFDKARHGGLAASMSRGFSQAGFDPLQCRHAFAFEVSFSRSSEDRLGSKAVLDSKSILHDPSQPVVLNFCHASKITNESPIRKLKNWDKPSLANLPNLSQNHFSSEGRVTRPHFSEAFYELGLYSSPLRYI